MTGIAKGRQEAEYSANAVNPYSRWGRGRILPGEKKNALTM